MANNFNKKAISRNFSNAAKSYNDHAKIQKIAAKNLVNLGQEFFQTNHKILDLGSGTGFIADQIDKKCLIFETDLAFKMLKSSFEPKKHKIQADFDNLPFKKSSFDILISSFSLQWANNFAQNLAQFAQILKENGIFILAIPTKNSLLELKSANIFNFNDLPSIESIKSAINSTIFKEILFKEEILQQKFNSGLEAIKSLKKIGANYSNSSQNKINKTTLQKFNNFCLKNFSDTDRKIHVSWNVSYFILQKI